MLKFLYDNESEIPADVRKLYAQDAAGKWVLQVDGAVSKAVVDEFRANNIKLQKTADELTAKYKDIDPDEARKLKGIADQLDEGKIVKAEGLEAAVTKRVEKMRMDYEGKLAEASKKSVTAMEEMGRLKIDQALTHEAAKMGLLPAATTDFVNRGRAVFKLDENGAVQAFEADGVTRKFGLSGTPLSIGEYVKESAVHPDYKHLFAPSGGSGAQGSGKGATTAANPFKKETFNLMEQANIVRADPTRANVLRAEAGIPVPG